eukprot:CAMPEP_0116556824 /NCGR_PEP_ID=MMETSP0397-20121206/8907_1 /TAXON_ID=216820 /ORGANISM="Cyclophora tenuis, Strain ECT3854" /LENGTH=189 /DNA_ID=CAMNT_0004082229 /DNA_START=13 /DNA_END=582 /DNA_ORIENTATION=-
MTIVDVFETDNNGKLLSYCPTFDNRAVLKTNPTTETIRKGSSKLYSQLAVVAQSPAATRMHNGVAQMTRLGFSAAKSMHKSVSQQLSQALLRKKDNNNNNTTSNQQQQQNNNHNNNARTTNNNTSTYAPPVAAANHHNLDAAAFELALSEAEAAATTTTDAQKKPPPKATTTRSEFYVSDDSTIQEASR